jgi:hypothetical protein
MSKSTETKVIYEEAPDTGAVSSLRTLAEFILQPELRDEVLHSLLRTAVPEMRRAMFSPEMEELMKLLESSDGNTVLSAATRILELAEVPQRFYVQERAELGVS